jgi:1,4-dihydroxy-2-naphthoate octaprenyltransferase
VISRSTLLHLRIPFSFYLMPVFFFTAIYPPIITGPGVYYDIWGALLHPHGKGSYVVGFLIAFFSIHLFLYPASNGFNSYYDKDEQAIGGLENPPPVSNELLYVSLVFDFIAVLLGLLVSWEFSFMLFVYGLVSKAYSHPMIRLKKYGVIAWLTAGIFQGGFTFLMVLMALQGFGLEVLTYNPLILPALISTLMILGFYPLTQVYQHEEDAKHGDYTISRQLGIRGTFILSLCMFLLADIAFFFFFESIHFYDNMPLMNGFGILQVFFAPVFIYFLWWLGKAWHDSSAANFRNTMRMNKIASWCLVSYFVFFGFSLHLL